MHASVTDGFDSIAIIGLGQMGASLGLALQKMHPHTHRIGLDNDAHHASSALAMGAIDVVAQSEAELASAQLIIFCTPMRSYDAIMANLAPHLRSGQLITDIGSAKQSAFKRLQPLLPKGVVLIPSHPIAGSEKSGPSNARPDFFEGRLFLLTPDEAEPEAQVQRLAALWQSFGAHTEAMPPELHDQIYAVMSHVPQLMAYGCCQVLRAHGVRAGGVDALFSRFIRIGRSDPSMWRDVFLENAPAVLARAEMVQHLLTHMRDELIVGAGDGSKAPDAATLMRLHQDIWPRMVASALIVGTQLAEQQLGLKLARYAAGGFIDTTAPATESPEPDFELVSDYPGTIIAMLGELIDVIAKLLALIEKQDEVGLMQSLQACQSAGLELVAQAH